MPFIQDPRFTGNNTRAPREPASTSRASLDALLAQLSEALAVAETCCRAFEAAHDRMDWTGLDWTGLDRSRLP